MYRCISDFRLRTFFFGLIFTCSISEIAFCGDIFFVRGDANADNSIDVTDAISVLRSLFIDGSTLPCSDAADVNDNGVRDLGDAVTLLTYLFLSGPPIPEPFPLCGVDSTEDTLSCESHQPCRIICDSPQRRPFVVSVHGLDRVCPGEVLTFVGRNFSCRLDDNRVLFHSDADGSVVEGVSLSVSLSPKERDLNGILSRLEVLVPTGVKSGLLSLMVNDLVVGGPFGYSACPMIHSFSIGVDCQDETVISGAIECCGLDPSLLRLRGINFDAVHLIVVEDAPGRQYFFDRQTFRMFSSAGAESVLGFSMENLRLASSLTRRNLKVWLHAGDLRSNSLFIPVKSLEAFTSPLGPVINGASVRQDEEKGTLRLDYSFYDNPTDCAYRMLFEWTADGENFYEALPADDPENDGLQGIFPGTLVASSDEEPSCSSVGSMRTFIWDMDNDSAFQGFDKKAAGITLRVRAEPIDCTDRVDPGILFETPPIAYRKK